MISKNDIKLIRSLSQKKFRDQYSLFIVEGEKMLNEALMSDYEIEYICREEELGKVIMSQISSFSTPSQVLAVIRQKLPDEFPALEKGKLYLALDSIRDPGNMGTIIRIADWFGIDCIFASRDCVELYNPKVIQASMGSIFRTKVHYCDLINILTEAKNKLSIYGTHLNGKNIYESKLSRDGIIVMGNESSGISSSIENIIDQNLLIPPYPVNADNAESLNVAIATAIVCSEFRRVSV